MIDQKLNAKTNVPSLVLQSLLCKQVLEFLTVFSQKSINTTTRKRTKARKIKALSANTDH